MLLTAAGESAAEASNQMVANGVVQYEALV